MELRQLRYFAEVAAFGSFSRAAQHLHLTQPAVSRQIKLLEEELGLQLLRRGQTSISLTVEGENFYEEARDLLGRADQLILQTRGHQGNQMLRVGYVPSLVATLLPRAIARFQASTRKVQVQLSDLTPTEICDMAMRRTIDVAIIPKGAESSLKGFQLIELHRLAPVLVMAKDHPLAKLGKIHPNRLKDLPLHGLGRSDFPEYALRLRAILRPFGVRPMLVAQTADGVATLFAALVADQGLAVLTEGIRDSLPTSLVCRPFSPALAPLAVLAALPAVQPATHAETFVRLLQEEAPV